MSYICIPKSGKKQTPLCMKDKMQNEDLIWAWLMVSSVGSSESHLILSDSLNCTLLLTGSLLIIQSGVEYSYTIYWCFVSTLFLITIVTFLRCLFQSCHMCKCTCVINEWSKKEESNGKWQDYALLGAKVT